jgi:hypothetical protein
MQAPYDGLATVFRSASFAAHMEAETIREMLETNGVQAFVTGIDLIAGQYELPGKEVLVQVEKDQKDEAERLIAEALKAGPTAAEEAEAASEGRLRPDV